MKKSILVLATVAAMSLPGMTASAQTDVEHGTREFYGFFLSNQWYNNAAYPAYGFAKQTFAFPADNELIYPFDGVTGIYAAACADGIYYACPYEFTSSMEEPTAKPVMVYNLASGLVEDLGEWHEDGATFKPSDMTYDIYNKKMYAICYGYKEGGTGVYELDMTNGSLSLVCSARGGVIAADGVGRIFTIDHDGWLYQINLSNGVATPVFNTKCTGLVSNQTMEFDHTTGTLYWASATTTDTYNDFGIDVGDRGRTVHLRGITLPSLPIGQNYTSSMEGFDMVDYGEVGTSAAFLGMYIPYAEGGFDAPGAVTDFTATSNATGNGTDLAFKLPVKTFGGDELTSINGYAIYRDGVEVAYSKEAVTPGQAVSWSESDFGEAGMYRYDVIVYNGEGDGPKTPAFAYIGQDRPAAAGDITVTIADDFASTEISWSAPTGGYHLGTYDPSGVTYDVVRLPDNYVVAEGLTETKATDTFFRRMLRYSYQVTAKNAYGETVGTSQEFIAGPAKTLPFSEDFIDQSAFWNAWMAYDNNNDGLTWLYSTSLGHAVFGDYEQCAEYIVSPTSIDSYTKDADEWLVTPPLDFEAGKSYTVTLCARVFDEETLRVHYGPKNTVEGMTFVEELTLNPIGVDVTTGSMAFGTYTVELPADVAGSLGCVGLQLVTPLGSSPSHYFQLNTVEVAETSSTGISTVEAEGEIAVRVAGHDIVAPEGSKVYDITGCQVGSTDLPAGIYVVATPSHKAVKVVVK